MVDCNNNGRRRHGARERAASAAFTVTISCLSAASVTRFAENHSEEIVQVWKDTENGKEVDRNDIAVQLALEWLEMKPAKISVPDIENGKRATEAYWILWAHTKSGGATLKRWKDELPGLGATRGSNSSRAIDAQPDRKPDRKSKYACTRDSGFGKYEVQRFLRELLTSGTKLNRDVRKPDRADFTARELIAMALLSSPDRTLTETNIVKQVNRVCNLYGGPKMSTMMKRNIKSVLKREETNFDNDFVVVRYVKKWGAERPMFRLPAGQENKVLKKRYELGLVGYFDHPMPDFDDQRIFDKLPAEIKVTIIRHLCKFDTKIHIINKTDRIYVTRPTYGFVIARPNHLIKTDSTGVDDRHGPHQDKVWSMDMGIPALALARVSREWRGLVREVFFGENRFVMGPFGSDASPSNSKRHHFDKWRQLVGVQASCFMRYQTYDELPQ